VPRLAGKPPYATTGPSKVRCGGADVPDAHRPVCDARGVHVAEKHPLMQYREGEPLRDLRKYLGEGQEDGQLVEVCQPTLPHFHSVLNPMLCCSEAPL